MTSAERIFLALVVLSAAFVFVHLWLVVRAFRGGARRGAEVAGLLFPPTAPIVAARHGARVLPFAWIALLTAYLALLFTKAV